MQGHEKEPEDGKLILVIFKLNYIISMNSAQLKGCHNSKIECFQYNYLCQIQQINKIIKHKQQ